MRMDRLVAMKYRERVYCDPTRPGRSCGLAIRPTGSFRCPNLAPYWQLLAQSGTSGARTGTSGLDWRLVRAGASRAQSLRKAGLIN